MKPTNPESSIAVRLATPEGADVETLRHQLRLLRFLTAISTDLFRVVPEAVDDGVRSLLAALGEFAEADRVALFLFSAGGEVVVHEHEWCRDGVESVQALRGKFLASEFPIWSQRLREFEEVIVHRPDELPPDQAAERSLLESFGVVSCAALPLVEGSRLAGCLVLETTTEAKAFPPETISLVLIAAGMAASVLSRRRTEDQRQRAEEQLRQQQMALIELARRPEIHAGDFSIAVRRIVETAAEVLGVGRASVWLLDRERTLLRCADLWERPAERHSGGYVLFRPDFPTYFAALETERAIAVHDAEDDPRTREFADSYLRPLGIRSLLDSPVRNGERLAGVVCFEQLGRKRRWTPEEEAFAGSMADLVALALEASDRAKAERALLATEGRYRLLFERNLAGVYRTTVGGRLLDCNLAFARMLGYDDPEELLQQTADALYSAPSAREAFLERLRENGLLSGYEIELVRRDGTELWGLENVSLLAPDGSPYPTDRSDPLPPDAILEGTIFDVTERKRAEQLIAHQAHHDGLTGLPNRTLFLDRLEAALAQAADHGRLSAVLLVDIDGFRIVNETMGHSVGDWLLQSAASRFREALRTTDTVARAGGDEFLVLLPEVRDLLRAESVARSLLDTLAAPFSVAGREVALSASLGIACFPEHGRDPGSLLRAVEAAAAHAKSQGRNQLTIVSPALSDARRTRQSLEEDVRRMIERRELAVVYQPQFDVKTHALVGAEALARRLFADGALGPPTAFIPVAEELGLINQIDEFVLEQAVSSIANLLGPGQNGFRISVNFSAREFRRGKVVGIISDMLAKYQLPPSSLICEITESAAIESLESTAAQLRSLRRLGIAVALDDFGVGYSALAYLKHFPVDMVKIDRSFLLDLFQGRGDEALVRAMVQLAHGLGLKVVAEGVETREQLEFLASEGCDEVQGFLLGKPEPLGVLATRMRAAGML